MLFFKRSIKLYKEIGNQGKVADGYIALGGAYQKKERYTKASNYYQQALKIETQLKDELGVSDCYLELGKLALVQKKHKKGQYYLEKALQIKKKLNTNTSLSETEMYLGSIFYHKRNFIEAKSYFNKAIETALKMGNPTIVRDASEYLTKVYEVLGQYKKALKYHRLFKKMTDSLLNKENIQQITRLESKVITQKREDSLKIIQEKKEAQHQIDIQKSEYRQRLILVGLGLSSALLLVLAFFYRSKQSNNQHLKIANEDIQNKAQAIAESNEKLQTINEEIKAKSEIVENQRDSLAQTLQQLKSTQTQLVQAEKMASLGQLTAGIAHEINNPINFVSGNIVSVEANLQDIMEIVKAYEQTYPENEKIKQLKQDIYYQDSIDEMATLVAGIKEGAHRTAEIVKGLRTFSRLDEDELKEADLHENIDSTLMLLHSQYKDRIVIEKDYAPLPPIECYPGKLNQVLMNLLANAIQAIEGKGTIKIATILAADDQVLISIADSGKGMDAVTQQRIFEPFFTTKDVGKGTGLGLSIALGIVEAHRGTLEVESEVGRGTVFGLRLPLKVNT
jgi:signal transduction histidine kinase